MLLPLPYEDVELKLQKYVSYLRMIFSTKLSSSMQLDDYELLIRSSATALGQMCKVTGTLSSDIVTLELQQSIQLLQRSDKRYPSLMILQSLAINVPHIFNSHVSQFLQYIWLPLKDIKPNIRYLASDTLYHVIKLISTRAARLRESRYDTIYGETQKQLSRVIHVESIHAGLLALSSMLSLCSDYILPRIKDIGDLIWRFRQHKERIVREQVLILLPKLCVADGDMYYREYVQFVIETIQAGESREVGFGALGELSAALGPRIESHLHDITLLVHDNLIGKKNKPAITEAVTCLSQVAQAVGELLVKYLSPELLDVLMINGLSTTLVQSLANLCGAIPQLLSIVQPRLLSIISEIFSSQHVNRRHGNANNMLTPPTRSSTNTKQLMNDPATSQDIHLALQCLSIFPFAPSSVAALLRVSVVQQLSHASRQVRLQAVKTSSALLNRIIRVLRIEPLNDPLIHDVVDKLLSSLLTDTDSMIRRTIIESMSTSLDELLSQPYNVNILFIALNDEALHTRESCISLIGRLASSYPSTVIPHLRQTITELITQLQLNDTSNTRLREESARLLRALIISSGSLLQSYSTSILSVLIPRLQDIDSRVTGACLACLAELSNIAGQHLLNDLDHILSVVLNILQDKASTVPRDLTLRCLAQIIRSTGYVIRPYETHPTLMPTLLSLVRSGHAWHIRREVLRLLGVLGALDPFKYRNYQQAAVAVVHKAPSNIVDATLSPDNTLQPYVDVIDVNGAARSELINPNITHEVTLSTKSNIHPGLNSIGNDYYSYVAVQALMRVLRDPTLVQQHSKALQASMLIMRTVGQRNSIKLLPLVIPSMIAITYTADDVLRSTILTDLSLIIDLVKQHISPYTTAIYQLVKTYWKDTRLYTQQILSLLERLNIHVNEQFSSWLPSLLPDMILSISNDKSTDQLLTTRSMHTFEIFGQSLNIYLHLIIPVIIRVAEQLDSPTQVRCSALHTLGSLAQSVDLSQYASRLLQPLLRIIDQSIDVSNIPGSKSQLPSTPGQSVRYNAVTPLCDEVLNTLCMLMIQLQHNFLIYMPPINKTLHRLLIKHELYDTLSYKLLHNQRVTFDDPIVQARTPHVHDTAPISNNNILLRAPAEVNRQSSLAPAYTTDDYWDIPVQSKALPVNMDELRRSWTIAERSNIDDWLEWQKQLSLALLRESPQQILRHCASVAVKQDSLGRELFNAGFLSCWSELDDQQQDELIHVLELACQAVNLPPDTAQTILNLAEFMERDDKILPINKSYLSLLAERNLAYAKALHYKELQFHLSPVSNVESLISLHNQLQQPDAAYGLLSYARTQTQLQSIFRIDVNTSWYESLNRYQDALEAYEYKQLDQPDSTEISIGRMRCLRALGEWPRLHTICSTVYSQHADNQSVRREIAPLGAAASWRLGHWNDMSNYLLSMDVDRADTEFYRAILAIHSSQYDDARKHLELARQLTDPELTALVSESYQRAYKLVLTVQQAEELEEVIEYKQSSSIRQQQIVSMWNQRMKGTQADVDVWQQMLSVRSLVVPPRDDIRTWLKFSSLCRKSNRLSLSLRVLTTLMYDDNVNHVNSAAYALDTSLLGCSNTTHPTIIFSYIKHLYAAGMKREAMQKLHVMSNDLQLLSHNISSDSSRLSLAELNKMRGKVYIKLGQWQLHSNDKIDGVVLSSALQSFRDATQCDDTYKVWNQYAFINYRIVTYYKNIKIRCLEQIKSHHKSPCRSLYNELNSVDMKLQQHVLPAVTGFIKSISYSKKQKLQDLLRLLSLWFEYGMLPEIESELSKGFNECNVDIWLAVVPQIIARIDSPHTAVRQLIADLLIKIGKEHPQALLYPLTVTDKSVSSERQVTAQIVLDSVRLSNHRLVDDAMMVSGELIRISVLWHEQWHEALADASKAWFGQSNIEYMCELLQPLYQQLNQPESLREISFHQLYAHQLNIAWRYVQSYRHTQCDADICSAWNIYLTVYKLIDKSVQSQFEQYMDLHYISPTLTHTHDLLLAMPGTFLADRDSVDTRAVLISTFGSQIRVIDSKQKPRKLCIIGNDGAEYSFLLKGREDLRQDKRVMQLLGLVNQFLHSDRETGQQDVSIKGYSVVPLSPNSGLIQWLSNCDTIHALVKQYREARNKLMNIENALIQYQSSDYTRLPALNKLEIFQHVLSQTTGDDLQQLLWLTSSSSEVWLDRRTSYTRSLAVMSMVGYVLGLGDRHPCNLMIERVTGKIVHIDFGDCFEVAMKRELYPEKIPFRLTRMLSCAMESSGIIGTYTSTCINTMRLMRDNKPSIMAVLEAFVYDPLISWRLVTISDEVKRDEESHTSTSAANELNSNKHRNIHTLQTIDEQHKHLSISDDMVPNSISDRTYNGRPGSVNRRVTRDKHKKRVSQDISSRLYNNPLDSTEQQDNMTTNNNGVSIDTAHSNDVGDADADTDAVVCDVLAMDDGSEVLNARALEVIGRVDDKLEGRDFISTSILSVSEQVDLLLAQATNNYNLAQCYIGWCPFW